TVEMQVPRDPLWVVGDSARLQQVLGILLGSAAQFTKRGGRVEVGATRDVASPRATIVVSSTGAGVEATLLPHLFEVYASSKGESASPRTGLGLALVKGLVELHGGQVNAASTEAGQGARIAFWLPLDEPSGEPGNGRAKAPSAGKQLRILIAEDN